MKDSNKNKLQQKICAIFQRTFNTILHIFSKLCVSLKRYTSTTEKDLFEKEKCGKFGKIDSVLINLYICKLKRKTMKDIGEFLRIVFTGDTKTQLIKGVGKDVSSDVDLTNQLYSGMDNQKEFTISKNGKKYKVTQLGNYESCIK